MLSNSIIQLAVYFILVTAISVPLGLYMARVFSHERTFLDPVLSPIERLIYKICGIDPGVEMGWVGYAASMLAFSLISMVFLYALQRLQFYLPLNPQGLAGVPPLLAFNTAASFTTNTNWQAYSGEQTMSYLTQMLGLTSHNFLSAASGIAMAAAVIRGFARRSSKTIGNFWVDLTRTTLWVLMPLSLIFARFLVWQGVPDNFSPYVNATTLEGAPQTIAEGPVASQEIIKELGTNGGGFMNVNSAHPYENPTPLTNLLEMLAILSIGAGLTHTFGKMVGDRKQGWALFAVMAILFLAGAAPAIWAEQHGNPQFTKMGIDQHASTTQSGGNMEGKETRFGIVESAMWATVTTDTSCGAVNSMHDSYTPLGGMIPMINMQLGEVIFGGVGSGLYGIIVMAVLAVFIAGLMVGRTPEYLGKKIEAREMKLAMLYVLIFPLAILYFSAWSAVAPYGVSSVNNAGPHGLSEILYAYSEAAGNNGSAFAGLNANTPWYNVSLGLSVLIGRFLMIVPALAIAGSLVGKKVVPASLGTFPTNGPLFAVLLVSVVIIVGALTFFPALALGPIVEHFLAQAGKVY